MTREEGTILAVQLRPAPRIRSADRSLVDPTPKTIDELIPLDAKARVVWRLVESLDLAPLYGKIKSLEGQAGRPAVDPRILVALWVYATDEQIASAHELALRTIDCDPYKWICGGVPLNYHTLSGLSCREFRMARGTSGRDCGRHACREVGEPSLRILGRSGQETYLPSVDWLYEEGGLM